MFLSNSNNSFDKVSDSKVYYLNTHSFVEKLSLFVFKQKHTSWNQGQT